MIYLIMTNFLLSIYILRLMFKVKSSLKKCKNSNQCNPGEECVILRKGAKLPRFLKTLKKRRNKYNKFKSKKGFTQEDREKLDNCTRATGTSSGCCHKLGKDWELVENEGRNNIRESLKQNSLPTRAPSSSRTVPTRAPSSSRTVPTRAPSSSRAVPTRAPSSSRAVPPRGVSKSRRAPTRPTGPKPEILTSPKYETMGPQVLERLVSSPEVPRIPPSREKVPPRPLTKKPEPTRPTGPKPEILTSPKYEIMGPQSDAYANPSQIITPAFRKASRQKKPSTQKLTNAPPPSKPALVAAATSKQIKRAKRKLNMEKRFGLLQAAAHKLTKKIRGEKNNITRSKVRKHFMRIMNNPELYNTSEDCNVETLKTLEFALLSKFQDFPTPSDLKIEHKIFPYLGEMINKLPKRLIKQDRVNYPSIPSDVLDLLTRVFNVNFSEPNKEPKPVSEFGAPFTIKKGVLTYPYLHQQEAVKNFVENIEGSYKSGAERKNLFVVTHSNFLLELLKYFNLKNEKDKTLVLDNLDILHIMYDNKEGFLVSNIYRWSENYEPYVLFRTNYVEKGVFGDVVNYEKNEETRHLFFMRHCAACHNHPKSNLIQKARYKSYGSRSMCFSNTFTEIKENIEPLNELIIRHGGLDNFVFGSSIIFRALLTGIVVQQQLKLLNRGRVSSRNNRQVQAPTRDSLSSNASEDSINLSVLQARRNKLVNDLERQGIFSGESPS